VEPYERLDEQVVHDGQRTIVRRRYRSHLGTEHTYEVTRHGGAVVVLPITADGDAVLTRQFRPGPERVVWELPSGYVEPGEEPAEAALRELREETGYTGELRAIGTVAPTPYSEELRQVFAAVDCRRVGDQDTDPDEHVEVVVVPLAHLRSVLRDGQMTTTDACYMALDVLGLL
jgi:ADP-ribose pyrophosphatase